MSPLDIYLPWDLKNSDQRNSVIQYPNTFVMNNMANVIFVFGYSCCFIVGTWVKHILSILVKGETFSSRLITKLNARFAFFATIKKLLSCCVWSCFTLWKVTVPVNMECFLFGKHFQSVPCRTPGKMDQISLQDLDLISQIIGLEETSLPDLVDVESVLGNTENSSPIPAFSEVISQALSCVFRLAVHIFKR